MITAADIAEALGGRRHAGYWTAKCPAHDDHSPSLSIRDGDNGHVLVRCHAGCSQDDVIDALHWRGLWGGERQQEWRPRPKPTHNGLTNTERTQLALRVWSGAVDPRSTPVEPYLGRRGIGSFLDEVAGSVIRFHAHCRFGSIDLPAMIAAMRDIRCNKIVAVHRTALDRDGNAVTDTEGGKLKMMLGPVADAAVKLSDDADVTMGLAIAEGIETGLALMLIGLRPVWALGTAGGVKSFPVLSGIESLTILADNDRSETGIRAARDCAARWEAAGREARIFMPAALGHDWNDEIMR